MVFIVLGVIALIAGFVLRRVPDLGRMARPARMLGFVLIAVGLLSSCVVQIDAGRIGIKKLFGRVESGVLGEGLHLVNPFVDVIELDARTQNYTMSSVRDEGQKSGDDAIRVLSADGLEVVIDLTVLYRVLPAEAPRLYRQTGPDYEDKIVRTVSRTRIRDNAVYYDAVALYSTRREEFQGRIFRSLEADFKSRGLRLENLLIRNIQLPATVRSSIEQKIQAEQEAQKMRFVLQKEQQEAERKRVEAQGIADYQRIVNQGLTEQQIQYESIKAMRELATSPNAKMIIMGAGRGTPVILDAK
jgi:regulator of protease activity HflC (stomatin/prohibitin superfamily)